MKDLSKVKLIVSDFDQTLTNKDVIVPKQTLDAIKAYMKSGGLFSIATGRALPLILPVIKDLNFESTFPLITYQGAVTATSKGNIIKKNIIPEDTVLKVVKYLEEQDLNFHISSENWLYARNKMKDTILFKTVNLFEKSSSFYDSIYAFLLANHEVEIIQISLLCDANQTDKIRDHLNQTYKDEVLFVKSHPQIIETTAINTSKGNAVKSLAKSYNLESNEVMIIGDSLNDLSMFETDFIKVAVENAEPILKEMADVITSSSDEFGVALIIDQIMHPNKHSD